jgi:carbonic anhydrase/acetyltransferase-like protein (isoleucine patch superfamily)
MPYISPSAAVHHRANLIGAVVIGDNSFVAPGATIRADEGNPIYIGKNSNVQDNVVIHGFKNKPTDQYSVLVGDNVSLAHCSLIHGPVTIGNDTFIGFKSLIARATIGKNCVVEHCATVSNCSVPDGRYVPAHQVIDSQEKANNLPPITDQYRYKHVDEDVIAVNKELAAGYRAYYQAFQQTPQQIFAPTAMAFPMNQQQPGLNRSFIG